MKNRDKYQTIKGKATETVLDYFYLRNRAPVSICGIEEKLKTKNKKLLNTTLDNLIKSGLLKKEQSEITKIDNTFMGIVFVKKNKPFTKISNLVYSLSCPENITVLKNDKCLVKITNKKRLTATVLFIVKREPKTHFGFLEKNNKGFFFKSYTVPGVSVYIKKHSVEHIKNSCFGKIKVCPYSTIKKLPEGVLTQFIPDTSPHLSNLLMPTHNCLVNTSLQIDSINEKYSKNVLSDYADLSQDKSIFTVSEKETTLHEIAISIKKENDLCYMKVFVPDVAYYIQENSGLDKYMINRGSGYIDSKFKNPLLPIEISEKLSLIKDKKRLCIGLYIVFNEEGFYIQEPFLFLAIIKVNANLTLSPPSAPAQNKTTCQKGSELEMALSLSKKLDKILLDIYREPNSDGLSGIKNVSNIVVSNILRKSGYPYLALDYEKVNKEKFINELGKEKTKMDLTHNLLQEKELSYSNAIIFLKETVKSFQEQQLLKKHVDRLFSQKSFCLKEKQTPLCDGFAHFTSPLQHFWDIHTQRLIKKQIKKRLHNNKAKENDITKINKIKGRLTCKSIVTKNNFENFYKQKKHKKGDNLGTGQAPGVPVSDPS